MQLQCLDTPDEKGGASADSSAINRLRGGKQASGTHPGHANLAEKPLTRPDHAATSAAAGGTRRVAKRGIPPFPYSPGRADTSCNEFPARVPSLGWNGSTLYGIWQRLRMSKPGVRQNLTLSGRSRTGSTCPSLPSRDCPTKVERKTFNESSPGRQEFSEKFLRRNHISCLMPATPPVQAHSEGRAQKRPHQRGAYLPAFHQAPHSLWASPRARPRQWLRRPLPCHPAW